jgi:hypothetical protein
VEQTPVGKSSRLRFRHSTFSPPCGGTFIVTYFSLHYNKTLLAGRSLCAFGGEGFAHFTVLSWKSGAKMHRHTRRQVFFTPNRPARLASRGLFIVQ